jgi:hypothetical protein
MSAMALALAAVLMLLHTSLTPAGAGVVGGIVLVSRTEAPDEVVETDSTRARVLWRLAIIATVASGVVHAAAVPHHAEENAVFGVFFFVSALVQFLWCTLAVLSPSRSLLTSGVVVNVALIVLWALTRTVGLPGLLDGPEEVGPWDVSSKIWELIALVCCVLLLPRWAGHKGRDWTFSSRTASWLVYSFLSVSAASLLVLALSGPPT